MPRAAPLTWMRTERTPGCAERYGVVWLVRRISCARDSVVRGLSVAQPPPARPCALGDGVLGTRTTPSDEPAAAMPERAVPQFEFLGGALPADKLRSQKRVGEPTRVNLAGVRSGHTSCGTQIRKQAGRVPSKIATSLRSLDIISRRRSHRLLLPRAARARQVLPRPVEQGRLRGAERQHRCAPRRGAQGHAALGQRRPVRADHAEGRLSAGSSKRKLGGAEMWGRLGPHVSKGAAVLRARKTKGKGRLG
eukprot:scaffold84152_cov54-Phaeocystis_antarctica.AAC.1